MRNDRHIRGGHFYDLRNVLPGHDAKKSEAQLEAEAAAAARKNKEFADQRKQFHSWSDGQDASFARKQKEHHEWQDEQNASFARKQKEHHTWQDEQNAQYLRKKQDNLEAEQKDRESFNRFNTTIDKIEHAVQGNEVLDVGNTLLEDDQKLVKLKNTAKAVADHKADPKELQKLADELLESRRELNRKDARRRQLFDSFKEKEWSANRLYKDADAKAREGKYREADELLRKADGMMRDADGIFCEFKSV